MNGVKIIELPTISDHRGRVTVAELTRVLPFEVERIFWIYEVPENKIRASHAHRLQQQVLFPLGGSFIVKLDDGISSDSFRMDEPSKGLLIPAGVWISISNFSTGAICLVLSPAPYDETEYIHDYHEFLEWKRIADESGLD